ncbi:hypothetical protein, partial [Klebsiella pneumoniae]
VQGIIDRRGLVGLLADPELRPARVVEPGTPEAVRAAESLPPASDSPQRAPARPEPDLAQETPVRAIGSVMELRAGQAGRSVED